MTINGIFYTIFWPFYRANCLINNKNKPYSWQITLKTARYSFWMAAVLHSKLVRSFFLWCSVEELLKERNILRCMFGMFTVRWAGGSFAVCFLTDTAERRVLPLTEETTPKLQRLLKCQRSAAHFKTNPLNTSETMLMHIAKKLHLKPLHSESN